MIIKQLNAITQSRREKFTPFKKSTLEEQVEDNMFQLAKSFNLPESYLDRRYLIEKIKIKYIN